MLGIFHFMGAGRNLVCSLHTMLMYTIYQRLIHELSTKMYDIKMATKWATKMKYIIMNAPHYTSNLMETLC